VTSGPQLTRNPSDAATVSPELAAAYRALIKGDYAVAKQQYQLVVRNDPFNLDAYLGLATASASTGDPATAQVYYRKALEIDPKSAVANAGLAAIQISENSLAAESQLKAQIAAQPQATPPHSTLGHVYASQGKWGDAQQAFFEAYRLGPSEPDHAFNLAVSLDHLGQSKLAREYYAKALSLAASRPASFNAAEVAARINQLAP
jgi:Tfp pilus assembly protein PilF